VAQLKDAPYPLALVYASPIVSVWSGNEKDGRTVSPLFSSADSAFARENSPDMSQELTQQPGDETGPFTLAMISTAPSPDPSSASTSVLVAAPAYLVEDSFLQYDGIINRNIATSIIAYASPESKSVVIGSKKFDTASDLLNQNLASASLWWGLFLFAIPVTFIVLGIMTWSRRRHL
jgi:hypothetical protein